MEEEQAHERARFIYQILSTLRASGTRDYHSLTSAYIAGNSILVAALSILSILGDTIPNFLILSISGIGLFLSFQMWLAQCRARAINTSYAERLRILENNNAWLPPIFNDVYCIEENQQLSDELEDEYYHTRGICWGRHFLGGRMKLLPSLFFILFLVIILYTCRESILLFLDP